MWEDASNKSAYGIRRRYFVDGVLDSCMNYPLRTAICNFLRDRDGGEGLKDTVMTLIENYPPPATKGKYIKIKYVTQLPTPTPQFAFFVNLPQYIKEPYRRFLENNIRDHWDFAGVPMQIYFRQK